MMYKIILDWGLQGSTTHSNVLDSLHKGNVGKMFQDMGVNVINDAKVIAKVLLDESDMIEQKRGKRRYRKLDTIRMSVSPKRISQFSPQRRMKFSPTKIQNSSFLPKPDKNLKTPKDLRVFSFKNNMNDFGLIKHQKSNKSRAISPRKLSGRDSKSSQKSRNISNNLA
mmetsp:Transcript_10060/g.8851  ORF Transcript_10060/g.8851 Transcript_10060/m.8851 type:complete len:168 (+) Transcript_10060:122-625(+)